MKLLVPAAVTNFLVLVATGGSADISTSLANASENNRNNLIAAFTSDTAAQQLRRVGSSSGGGNNPLNNKTFFDDRHKEMNKNTSRSFLSKISQNMSSASITMLRSRSMQEIGWNLMGDEINAEAYYDRAGDAVSINADGTRVAFGAYNNRGGRGHVKVFDYNKNANKWTQVGATISGLSGDESGSSISLSDKGDILAVGSPNHSNYLGTTRVYKYEPDLDLWMPLGVDIDGLESGDKNGESVYLSGDGNRLALGADEAGENQNGYARVFEFDGGSWVQLGQTISGLKTYYGTGSTVALNTDGSRLIVSSNLRPSSNLRLAGGVEVYQYDATLLEWVQMGQSFHGNTYYELLGEGADINSVGDRIAIGVRNHDPVSIGKNAGMVQVFQYDGTIDTWVQMGRDIYGVEKSDGFGMSVSIDGDGNRVLAGAGKADSDGLKNNGEARVFEYDETLDDWVQVGNTVYGECDIDQAGRAVDISRDGRRIVVGAPLNWYYSGHIRIFEAVPGPHVSDIRPSCYTAFPQPTTAPVPTPSPTSSPTIKVIEYKTFGIATLESNDIAFCSKEDEVRDGLIAALAKAADDSTEVVVLDGVQTNCPSTTERRLQDGLLYYFDFTLEVTRKIPEREVNNAESVEDIFVPKIEIITIDFTGESGLEPSNIEIVNIKSPTISPTATPSIYPSLTPSVSPSSMTPSKVQSSSPSNYSTPEVSSPPSNISSATETPTASPTAKSTSMSTTVLVIIIVIGILGLVVLVFLYIIYRYCCASQGEEVGVSSENDGCGEGLQTVVEIEEGGLNDFPSNSIHAKDADGSSLFDEAHSQFTSTDADDRLSFVNGPFFNTNKSTAQDRPVSRLSNIHFADDLSFATGARMTSQDRPVSRLSNMSDLSFATGATMTRHQDRPVSRLSTMDDPSLATETAARGDKQIKK